MLNPCGTRTHARAVLREILAAVPEGIQVESLSDYRLPLLDPAEYPRIDDEWDRGNVDTVGAFFNLSALGSVAVESDLPLLTNPGIRTASIWLDAIVGLYPHLWLTSMDHIFGCQLQMECLGRHDWLVALSQTSATEAALVAKPDAKITISGAWNAHEAVADDETTGIPFAHYVAVVGSDLPHKNVVAGVAGAAPLVASRPDWGIVVSGDIAPAAAEALRSMAASLGLPHHQLIINTLPETTTHAALLKRADAVVVPSFHEGYSLPVVEAIDLRTAVVLSDIPAHRELLPDGPYYFDPADPATLTTALGQTLENCDSLVTQQLAATEQVRDRSNFSESIQRIVLELCAELDPQGRKTCSSHVRELIRPRETASLSKICEVEDFAVPRVRDVIREVFSHELVRFGDDFPTAREYRKNWEVAMAVLAFREGGHLNGTSRLLGVGAGNEPTVFFLTRFAQEVIATDLYLSPGWEESANASMLTEPEYHWPFSWNPARLTVQHMDAMNLDLPDESVDGIFSSSSVEHFGTRADVATSIDEAFRVLKPGGVLSISTEFCLRGSREGFPGVLLFDEDDIKDIFLGTRDWALMEPFDSSVSSATRATAASFPHVVTDQQKQIDHLGGLWTHHIEYAKYPHIILNLEDQQWTSFHIALQKPS
jgi:glycosyltransferase involved in cell wall biosynthesis/SAM-dependent methyltransferase